jgi:hypothetical protein
MNSDNNFISQWVQQVVRDQDPVFASKVEPNKLANPSLPTGQPNIYFTKNGPLASRPTLVGPAFKQAQYPHQFKSLDGWLGDLVSSQNLVILGLVLVVLIWILNKK